MATDGSGERVPQPTATSGRPAATPASAATAEVCGAMTMIPSTAWSRNRSTASTIECRSSAGRLAMVTE